MTATAPATMPALHQQQGGRDPRSHQHARANDASSTTGRKTPGHQLLRQAVMHAGKPSNADASAVAYPPYPSRLLKAGSSGQLPAATGTVHQPRQQQQRDAYVPPAARRVRPIAVAPPPGLGGSVLDQQQRAHSMQHFNTAPLQQQQPPLAASTDLFAPAGFAQASAGGYSALVKFRAIAGALAGDWSSGRPLPDMPAFLLAELMSDYMQGNSGAQLFSSIFAASSSSTVESGATTAAGLSAANPGKTSFHTFMAGGNITATGAQGSATNAAPPSTELAHFCKNNNINSNVVVVPSPQRATAIFGGSAMSQQMQHQQSPLLPSGVALNIPQHVRSGLDERLQSPYRAQQQVLVDNAVDDDKYKRRLAPTQITTDNIFPLKNIWKKNTFDVNKTPTKSGSDSESRDFARTPRAPKSAEAAKKRTEMNLQKEITPLDKIDQAAGEFTSYFHNSDFGTSDTELANVASATTAAAANTSVDSMDAIPAKRLYKIPPPPEASLEHRLAQRQKQLDIGKATPEYRNYRATVPRKQRKKTDPGTPDKFQLISKRNWEGQVKAWRRRLHEWDTPEDVEEGDDEKENGGSVAKKETMASLLFKKAGAADNARPVVAASNDEDGEIPQWKLDDDRYFEQFGGHEKWEAYMVEHMRRKLAAMPAKEAAELQGNGGSAPNATNTAAPMKVKHVMDKSAAPKPLSSSTSLKTTSTNKKSAVAHSTTAAGKPRFVPISVAAELAAAAAAHARGSSVSASESASATPGPLSTAYNSQEVSRVQTPAV